MSDSTPRPPILRRTIEGGIDVGSAADIIEWFLQNDQRVGLIRHPQVEELFQWKQKDDKDHGQDIYPFENAEARFAIGALQALSQNQNENSLRLWMTDVLQALGEAKQTNEDFAKQYSLDQAKSHLDESMKIATKTERRLYLTSAWLEALCTAEVRLLGWIYQELYGKPFQPIVQDGN